jgi:AcrR family transcriptional regulator
MPKLAVDTRNRLLEAADAVFAKDGLRAGSMDRIAAHAGVTKRTLYYHFRSKDDLIAACLSERDIPLKNRLWTCVGGDVASVAAGIRNLLETLAESVHQPRWAGCGFLRAAFELAELPGHPGRVLAARHKHAMETFLAERLRLADLPDPEAKARRLMLVLDGAIAQLLVHKDVAYAAQAQELVGLILTDVPAARQDDLAASQVTERVEPPTSGGHAGFPERGGCEGANQTHPV